MLREAPWPSNACKCMRFALQRGGLRRVWRRRHRGYNLCGGGEASSFGSYAGIPRRHISLILWLAHHVGHVLHARSLRHCSRAADRVPARSADDARHRRPCAALGTVCAGRAFRFGGMTVEAAAHLDATATTAAATAAAERWRVYSPNLAARMCLMLLKRVYGGPPHGHTMEPVVDILASQLDLSAPRPPADHRQAA